GLQQDQVGVEARMVLKPRTEHGREDDGRMPEDHGEGEAEEDAVQDGIVAQARHLPAEHGEQYAARDQPGVASQQRGGDEADQPVAPDGARGDVVAQQPQPYERKPYPRDPAPGVKEEL